MLFFHRKAGLRDEIKLTFFCNVDSNFLEILGRVDPGADYCPLPFV